jgi:hypothetical protein
LQICWQYLPRRHCRSAHQRGYYGLTLLKGGLNLDTHEIMWIFKAAISFVIGAV